LLLVLSAVGCTVVLFFFSVTTGSKRASDDGQDVDAADNGQLVKRPRQDDEGDVHAELKILLPSRVSTLLQHLDGCFEVADIFRK